MTRNNLANAIWSLNAILVVGRHLAREKASHDELAEIFDAAEILPILILEDADKTELFRDILEGLARKFPLMQQAVDRFNGTGTSFVRD